LTQPVPLLHFKQCDSLRTWPESCACNCIAIHERIVQQRAVQSYLRTHPDEAAEVKQN
jgi:hypothetical protein